jgi:tetratricopeptide (TPR) repeat protein
MKLAESADLANQPAQTLSLLVEVLDTQAGAKVLLLARQKYPDDFWLNFQSAWTYEHASPQDWKEACRFYSIALALRPRNVPTHLFLSRALHRQGKLDESLAVLRRAVDLAPGNASAHLFLGHALVEKGDWDSGSAHYGEVIRLTNDPQTKDQANAAHAEYRARVSRANLAAKLGDWDTAGTDFGWLVASGPPSDSWFAAACLHLLHGDTRSYVELCQELQKRIGQTNVPNLAHVGGRAGLLSPTTPIAPTQLVRWAEQAVTAHKYPWRLHTLAAAHYRAGQFEQAIARAQESLQVGPDWKGRVLNWLVLALAHQRLGHQDEARQWLAQVVQWRETLPRGKANIPRCPPSLHGWDWLEFQVLMREAEPFVNARP